MKDNEKIWWEKTVEYTYVRKYLGEYEIIFPLDGSLEKLSDAMVGDSLRWIIIEFKASKAWETPERKKFDKYGVGRYEKAKKDLLRDYGFDDQLNFGVKHHFIVYGELNDVDDLYLKTEQYFSIPETSVFSPKNLLSNGIEQSRFLKYITRFNRWKSPPDNGGTERGTDDRPSTGPRGGLAIKEYGVVFGVGVKDKVVVCMTMEDFINQAFQSDKDNEQMSHQGSNEHTNERLIEKTFPPEEQGVHA